MPELADCRGVNLTAASPDAVAAWDTVVDEYLRAGPGVMAALEALAKQDPEMPMAPIMRGYLLMLSGIASVVAGLPAVLAEAERLSTRANARERAHLAALNAWHDGRLNDALTIWDEILVEEPRDLLAFRLAHYLYFYVGRLEAMRDSAARAMARLDDNMPGHGYLLGCWAFSLEETGAYAPAEAAGRRAVEIEPRDIWAGHAVAHVLEMQGRAAEGIAWVDAHEGVWRGNGLFRNHVWWHRALYRIERGDVAGVLRAYDTEFWASPSEDNLDFDNAAAVLQRLEIMGVDVGERWQPLATIAAGRVGDHLRPFNDLHFVMAAVGAGRFDTARDLIASAEAFVADPANAARTVVPTMRRLSIPIAKALLAYGEGNHARTLELMAPIRTEMRALGGSWAQRDVWEQVWLSAALRAGRPELARAVWGARAFERVHSVPTWQLYADALTAAGDSDRAGDARRRAEALAA